MRHNTTEADNPALVVRPIIERTTALNAWIDGHRGTGKKRRASLLMHGCGPEIELDRQPQTSAFPRLAGRRLRVPPPRSAECRVVVESGRS